MGLYKPFIGDVFGLSRIYDLQVENIENKNFDIGTNYSERNIIDQITKANSIFMQSRTDCESYWYTISKSFFIISPPGNGIDCHRIWESLYLKTVPIVKYHEALEQFKELPICFVEDWNNVTVDWLKSKNYLLEQLRTKLAVLDFSYWKKIITEL
jgi:hypothetical protein